MGSLSVLRDREFVALSGTAFARAQAYSTIAIALALYLVLVAALTLPHVVVVSWLDRRQGVWTPGGQR